MWFSIRQWLDNSSLQPKGQLSNIQQCQRLDTSLNKNHQAMFLYPNLTISRTGSNIAQVIFCWVLLNKTRTATPCSVYWQQECAAMECFYGQNDFVHSHICTIDESGWFDLGIWPALNSPYFDLLLVRINFLNLRVIKEIIISGNITKLVGLDPQSVRTKVAIWYSVN